MKSIITKVYYIAVATVLNTRVSLRSRLSALALSKLKESSSSLDSEQELLINQRTLQTQLAYLAAILRCYPFWKKGHLLLAELAFSVRDYKLAYGSAQAVLTLSPAHSEESRAVHLLGRCYLAGGANDRARESLTRAERMNPTNYAVKEDLAAALIALGEKAGARKILETIPTEKISQEAKTALAYLMQTPSTN